MNKTHITLNHSEFLSLWLAYLFYFLMLPAVVGLIINAVKIYQYKQISTSNDSELEHTLNTLNAHHHWLVRTFIVVAIMAMASIGTMFYGFGYLIAAGALIWWFYRVLRGMFALTTHKVLPIELEY